MVERAKAVAEVAPELVEKIKSGEITVGEAEDQIEETQADESDESDDETPNDLQDTGEFLGLVKKIKAVLKDVEELSRRSSGRLLNMQQIEAALNEAAGAITFAMPYCECPYQHSEGSECKACANSEWLTKAQFDRVPKSIKKNISK
jgi:hypothetical protein